jgi:osmotically inducible protein OsmC
VAWHNIDIVEKRFGTAVLDAVPIAQNTVTENITVNVYKKDFYVTKIQLQTEGAVPGIDEKTFKETAEKAKTGCPVSQALSATPIELEAKLIK